MIVGSGLLATAFADRFSADPEVCIYAAGVSNSACTDPAEFARERARLEASLESASDADAFVYFSTCSIDDLNATDSHYVRHKISMEALVGAHRRCLIVRLPQIAGLTPNPHTLLNYLHARVVRSEHFTAWRHATRNVIDVDDVAATVTHVVTAEERRGLTLNVANPRTASVEDIVTAFEQVAGKVAVVSWIDAGKPYSIDVGAVLQVYAALGLTFDDGYLLRILRKYYDR